MLLKGGPFVAEAAVVKLYPSKCVLLANKCVVLLWEVGVGDLVMVRGEAQEENAVENRIDGVGRGEGVNVA